MFFFFFETVLKYVTMRIGSCQNQTKKQDRGNYEKFIEYIMMMFINIKLIVDNIKLCSKLIITNFVKSLLVFNISNVNRKK